MPQAALLWLSVIPRNVREMLAALFRAHEKSLRCIIFNYLMAFVLSRAFYHKLWEQPLKAALKFTTCQEIS